MKTILDFSKMKTNKEKISMLTCYDYWSAKLLSSSNVDLLLVGDSVAMVMHGYSDTLSATTDMMGLHTSAVRKGAPSSFIVTDVPFMEFRKSKSEVVETARKLMAAGASGLKGEGALGNLEMIRFIVDSGVPVMGHLGLTPQMHNQLGGYKVQARKQAEQEALKEQALQLQNAGCFALVLECVPAALAKEVTQHLQIPVIGIGSGSDCDGQVLVLQDMLGANSDFKPKFVRSYERFSELVVSAANHFVEDVKDKSFPSEREMYT